MIKKAWYASGAAISCAVIVFSSGLAVLPFQKAQALATPSTNDTNRTNDWAHVDQIHQEVGSTELQFISTRALVSCFEYRTDGDVSQQTSTTNFNPNITDGLYPYFCQNNNTNTHTITANSYVEVRLVFGGETDERFDWTRFNVLVNPMSDDSSFVGSPKYVRNGNFTSDIVAQVRVPSASTGVRFIVDGNSVTDTDYSNGTSDNDIYTVSGAAIGSQWYRLQKNLTPGQHDISAEFTFDHSMWFPVTGTGTAYSIDAPTASYVLPSTESYYRSSDNPIRLKVEDEFEQFARMVVKINSNSYEILRDNCTLTYAGNYLLCDVNKSLTWTSLTEGVYSASTTTYTKANNRLDNLSSNSFTVDSTRPVLTNFQVTTTGAVFGDSIELSAEAVDVSGIKNVEFYLTNPRLSDGACDGNGAHLLDAIGVLSAGSYVAGFDTSSLDGVYCVNALAEDLAANHSTPIQKIKITLDNTAPAVTANSLASTNTSPEITGTIDDLAASVEVKIDGTTYIAANNSDGSWVLAAGILAGLTPGVYNLDVISSDILGNIGATTATLTIQASAFVPLTTPPANTPAVLGVATGQDAGIINRANTPAGQRGNFTTPESEDANDAQVLAATDQNENKGEVAGASTTRPASTTINTPKGINFMWLLLGLPVVAGILYYLFGFKNDEN